MPVFVMTGGSSGLGRVAADELGSLPAARLFLGARARGPERARTLRLDLLSLDSVRAFAAAVREALGPSRIDALVMNAGAGLPGGRTAEGLEANFVVNYLGHYLLYRLLEDRIAAGGVVTITTSGTHDPEARTIIPPPRHASARLLAHPELDPARDAAPRAAAGRAYASAKLCNILFVRALIDRAAASGRRIAAVAWTALGRSYRLSRPRGALVGPAGGRSGRGRSRGGVDGVGRTLAGGGRPWAAPGGAAGASASTVAPGGRCLPT
jgi:NAD(P)-dependent dehydrogenase (short-subunit alcohol dehydrogenase family)